MTIKTAAQLKAEFQSTDPQDFMNDLVDSAMKAGSSTQKGQVELATNAEALAAQSTELVITPANLGNVLAKVFPVSFTGSNLAGPCTATGVAVGDWILGVSGITDMGIVTSKFEAHVTVVNQIQQSAAENLSAKNFTALVFRPS
jgi:hypothetical protein